MKSRSSLTVRCLSVGLTLLSNFAYLAAQNRPAKAPPPPEDSIFSSIGLYVGLVAVAGLIGVMVMRRKSAAKEKVISAVPADGGIRMTYRPNAPRPLKKKEVETPKPVEKPAPKEGFAALPINEFVRLKRSNAYLQLPDSQDLSLLDAIEQTSEDSDADAQTRTLALKILATFKTSNSVAAIAQIALYDFSSKLRSDAVSILAAMDHDSVFETIVTACADPSREVRAAAARALFKLTFDRAQAWTRVIESGDAARMRHVARCAIEGDLVQRSFDRLAHTDRKAVYEAFALTALLIRSGESEPVYKALVEHRDENVKLALLHVMRTVRDENTFEGLSDLLVKYNLSPKVAEKINEVRSYLQMTHA